MDFRELTMECDAEEKEIRKNIFKYRIDVNKNYNESKRAIEGLIEFAKKINPEDLTLINIGEAILSNLESYRSNILKE